MTTGNCKMNSKCAIVFLLVLTVFAGGCRPKGGDAPTPKEQGPATRPELKTDSRPAGRTASRPATQPDSRPVGEEVISVSTPDELISAIGPNRTIKLRPGVYDISSVAQRQMDFILWAKVHDGYEVIVRNVTGLKIIGAGKAPELLAKPRYANVLSFDNCKSVTLENLVLGHTPEGYCTGGVVRMNKCSGMTIDKCDLFGCGIEGLMLSGVTGLKFKHSTIRDCTYGIMTVSGSRGLVLSDSKFIRNKEFGGFSFSDSRNIRFERCEIKDNHFDSLDANLYSATSCSDIVISGGEITGNVYKGIMSPIDCVKIIDTKIEGNTEPPPGDR